MNAIENILELIRQGETKEAIDAWLKVIGAGDPIREELDLFTTRFNTLTKMSIRGSMDTKEENQIRNKLNADIHDRFKSWRPGGDHASLLYAIEQLGIDPINEIATLHLVNCDRHDLAIEFNTEFKRLEGKSDLQFCFICGCETEMPQSFATRLIHEFTKDHPQKLILEPRQRDTDHIEIKQLPIGKDLTISKINFKAYICERFNIPNTEQSFEEFIKTGRPISKYHYVTTGFFISESEWESYKGVIPDFFEWMIRIFQSPNKGVPPFLFFVVITRPNLHVNTKKHTERRSFLTWVIKKLQSLRIDLKKQTDEQSAILDELVRLREKYPDQTTKLDDFSPVEEKHFHDWVNGIVGIRNPNLNRAITKALAATFDPGSEEDVLYRTQQKFHVKDIEPVQRQIFIKASK